MALVGAGATVAVALLAHFFGFWRWAGGEISKWLEHRREIGKSIHRVPMKTLHFVVGTTLIPLLMNEHDASGRISTDCRGPVRITNLNDFPVIPTRIVVTVCGLERFRRKAYQISLTGDRPRVGDAVPPKTSVDWWLIFQIFPALPSSKNSLRVNITLFDHFGNAHHAKKVRFTRGDPNAMPREWEAQFKPPKATI